MLRTLIGKLLLAGVGLLLGVAIAAAFIITNVLFIRTAVDHLTDHISEQAMLSGEFNTDVFASMVEAGSFARTHDPADRAAALRELRNAHTVLDQLGAATTQNDIDPGVDTAQMDLQHQRVVLLTAVEASVQHIVHAVESNDTTATARSLADMTRIETDVETIEEHSEDLAKQSIHVSIATISTVIQRAIDTAVGLFGLFALAVLGLLLFIRHTIVRPIAQLSAVARTVADGQLDHTIAVTNHDEIGSLQATFNHMISSLRMAGETVAEYQSTLEAGVAERTTELGVVNQQLQLELAERTRAEAALEEERALLAWRVAERTADLSAANAQLAHAARLKDEFLASMSHELRTPLNTILGMAETLQEGIFGSINAEQTDALHHIEESGRHLLALINDILDLSKVEAGKLELAVADVGIAQVCQATLRLVKQTATQKRLNVSLNIDSAVTVLQADVRRLKQMLVNLLSNAVKFTPAGGAIGLDVVGDAAAKRVRLTVWDTGIGIAADDLARLFQPFVQLDSRLARQYAGTGLGLALVQRMAALHGGSVAVESTLGHGSRFTITLPWTAAIPVSDPVDTVDLAKPSVASGFHMQRALVIEDSPPAAAQLVRYLRELGAEASVHSCGVGALEAVLDVCPDVIILDIQLPDFSGWEVLLQLKADPRVRSIPVVIVSVVDDRLQGMALGAAGYLVKPISRHQLQDALSLIVSSDASQAVPTALIVAPDQPQATPAPVILLAEDDENNIRTLTIYLEAKGYQLVVARNGVEALDRAHDAMPALILMDVQMPGMDGLEAIRRIRADTTLPAIPIIALTALAMTGDRERCLAAGADDYLSKPVSLKGLVTAIESHLHHPVASLETINDKL